MFIPETIGTLAALISLIDYMIRFAKFLSPPEKQALGEAREKIIKLNPASSVEQAKPILYQAIQQHLPDTQVEIAMEDLSLGLEALEQYAMGLNTAMGTAIPAYGSGLAYLCRFIGKQFTEWRCFEAWGRNLVSRGGVRYELILLPMPYSDQAIKHNLGGNKLLLKSSRFGSWYYYANKGKNQISPGNFMFTNFRFYNETLLQSTHLRFEDYDFSIDRMKGKRVPYSEIVRGRLNAEIAEQLAAGFLSDLIDYSRRVRGEVQKSDTVKSRLSGLLKG